MTAVSELSDWVLGGCQCGAIRYRVDLAQVLTLYRCPCRDCQKLTSTAFGLSMFVPETAFELLQGRPKQAARRADSGRIVDSFFCDACGSRIYNTSPARPGLVNARPGTLDHPGDLQPVGDLWTDSKQAWVALLEGGLHYPRQPDNLEALVARYQAGG